MSSVAEMARAEAERAEAESPDESPAAPPAESPAAPPAEQTDEEKAAAEELARREQEAVKPAHEASGEPSKRQLAALDKELVRHEAAIHDAMGEFVAGFVACEACSGVGLVPPGPTPRPHAWFKTCPTCVGFGQVLTGSLSPGSEAVACPDCAGRGYLEAVDPSGTSLAELAKTGVAPSSAPSNGAGGVELGGAQEPQAAGEQPLKFGRPAWMGDPTIGS